MSARSAAAVTAADFVVDLVFDAGCPNVGEARTLLRRALIDAGLPDQWREWKHDDAGTPPALRGLGSPTILVNGTDVSDDERDMGLPVRANSCRIYRDGDALRGVPGLDTVARALARARPR